MKQYFISVCDISRNQNKLFPDKEYSKLTVDDLLKLDPSEMSEDILQPIKIGEKNRLETSTGDCYLTLLKEEVKEIKSKFETNNGKWNLDDLVKLTENTLSILRMEDVSPRHAGEKILESVLYNQYTGGIFIP